MNVTRAVAPPTAQQIGCVDGQVPTPSHVLSLLEGHHSGNSVDAGAGSQHTPVLYVTNEGMTSDCLLAKERTDREQKAERKENAANTHHSMYCCEQRKGL
jgi:hypothetical protein